LRRFNAQERNVEHSRSQPGGKAAAQNNDVSQPQLPHTLLTDRNQTTHHREADDEVWVRAN